MQLGYIFGQREKISDKFVPRFWRILTKPSVLTDFFLRPLKTILDGVFSSLPLPFPKQNL